MRFEQENRQFFFKSEEEKVARTYPSATDHLTLACAALQGTLSTMSPTKGCSSHFYSKTGFSTDTNLLNIDFDQVVASFHTVAGQVVQHSMNG